MKLRRTTGDATHDTTVDQTPRPGTAVGAGPHADAGAGRPEPTFTPAAAPPEDDSPAPGVRPHPAGDDADLTRPAPAAPRGGQPLTALPADEPLLANTAGLEASWRMVQAGFVDDPRAAVAEAADLIEQTAQSLIDALQQRQRQLRVLSERGAAGGTAGGADGPAAPGYAASEDVSDTEHLRLMMQRYRSLFSRMCRA